jgi:hypothetical protein
MDHVVFSRPKVSVPNVIKRVATAKADTGETADQSIPTLGPEISFAVPFTVPRAPMTVLLTHGRWEVPSFTVLSTGCSGVSSSRSIIYIIEAESSELQRRRWVLRNLENCRDCSLVGHGDHYACATKCINSWTAFLTA